ncbi:NmrA family NAD(P)-binding protein [Enterobacter asburiae]|uniref:NmrA family NAD(P)-binding protein n=2 Tax=Enterobacter asburiae TaxID=61645 RepID=UPI002DC2915B|nr:NmrA family NAD(P)-binding protein [Enterobacter asburiae]
MTSECVFSRAAIVTLIVSDRTSSTVICGYASFICAITEGRTSVPMISLAATRTKPRNPVAPELKLAADRSIIMAVSTNQVLILGATGGIGGEITRKLIRDEWDVRALRRSSTSRSMPILRRR